MPELISATRNTDGLLVKIQGATRAEVTSAAAQHYALQVAAEHGIPRAALNMHKGSSYPVNYQGVALQNAALPPKGTPSQVGGFIGEFQVCPKL